MFKTLIAGAAALGLLITAAPQGAKAGDEVLTGIVAGAVLGGLVGAIAHENNRQYDGYRRSYSRPVHVAPVYAPPRHVYSRPYYSRSYARPIVVERNIYHARPAYRRDARRDYRRDPRVERKFRDRGAYYRDARR
ncbi:MAG: hypothetical protein WD969_02635 [Paracoccaceae bacterium]